MQFPSKTIGTGKQVSQIAGKSESTSPKASTEKSFETQLLLEIRISPTFVVPIQEKFNQVATGKTEIFSKSQSVSVFKIT